MAKATKYMREFSEPQYGVDVLLRNLLESLPLHIPPDGGMVILKSNCRFILSLPGSYLSREKKRWNEKAATRSD
jgi:hypothetical protein